MTEEKCIFINSVSPYFLMLERINENLLDIINNILMKKGEPYYVSEKNIFIKHRFIKIIAL